MEDIGNSKGNSWMKLHEAWRVFRGASAQNRSGESAWWSEDDSEPMQIEAENMLEEDPVNSLARIATVIQVG